MEMERSTCTGQGGSRWGRGCWVMEPYGHLTVWISLFPCWDKTPSRLPSHFLSTFLWGLCFSCLSLRCRCFPCFFPGKCSHLGCDHFQVIPTSRDSSDFYPGKPTPVSPLQTTTLCSITQYGCVPGTWDSTQPALHLLPHPPTPYLPHLIKGHSTFPAAQKSGVIPPSLQAPIKSSWSASPAS